MAHVSKEKNTVEREKIVKRGVTVGKEKGGQRERMVGGEAQSGEKGRRMEKGILQGRDIERWYGEVTLHQEETLL